MADRFVPPEQPSDKELILQTLGPRPTSPTLPIVGRPLPPEPGLQDPFTMHTASQAQAAIDALRSLSSGIIDTGYKTALGGRMAAHDATSAVLSALGLHGINNILDPMFRDSPKIDPSKGIAPDIRGYEAAPEEATAHAFDFLYGANRDTHKSPATLEAERTQRVRTAQDALAAKINTIGHYEDLPTAEQIRSAMFPDRGPQYDTRSIPEQTNANNANIAEQKRLAQEAIGNRDPRALPKDLGDVVTFPFDIANTQIDNANAGLPADAVTTSPTVEAIAANEHRTNRSNAVTPYTGRNEETQRIADALGPPVMSVPVDVGGNDLGMESDITVPPTESIPPPAAAKDMLRNDPGLLLRTLQSALVPTPRPKPDIGMEQDRTSAPPDAVPIPRHKPKIPPVQVVQPARPHDPLEDAYRPPSTRDNGSVPTSDVFPQPAASIMRGADQRISGMKMGDKLISFERGPDGRITNIHIFQGR